MLVVIGVIVLLLGLLFPALNAFRRSGQMAKSMSNMRQIGAWMKLYSGDNRDSIVPSQFNYQEASYPGKVRSAIQTKPIPVGEVHRGTWADILWTVNGLGPIPEAAAATELDNFDYAYDSPDKAFTVWAASSLDAWQNPLRSSAPNSRNTFSPHDLLTPFGPGAGEIGLPGYFAANNFFNADPEAFDWREPSRAVPDAQWWTTAQIRLPEKSMYLVDSFAGEIVQPWVERWEVSPPEDQGGSTTQVSADSECRVDFRYGDTCLMLMLDGHVDTVQQWDNIDDLEGPGGLGIRIRGLDLR